MYAILIHTIPCHLTQVKYLFFHTLNIFFFAIKDYKELCAFLLVFSGLTSKSLILEKKMKLFKCLTSFWIPE